MTEKTTIDLIRHGEPEGGERFRGWRDDKLTPQGWRQMHHALRKASPWQSIITSPLKRCRDFAIAIGQEKRVTVKQVEPLKEIGFGDWEGKTAIEIQQADADLARQFWISPLQYTPPNGEPLQVFADRVISAWEEIVHHHRGQHILIVGHGGTVRVILSHVLEMPLSAMLKLQVPYACCSRVHCYYDDNDKPIPNLVSHGSANDLRV